MMGTGTFKFLSVDIISNLKKFRAWVPFPGPFPCVFNIQKTKTSEEMHLGKKKLPYEIKKII